MAVWTEDLVWRRAVKVGPEGEWWTKGVQAGAWPDHGLLLRRKGGSIDLLVVRHRGQFDGMVRMRYRGCDYRVLGMWNSAVVLGFAALCLLCLSVGLGTLLGETSERADARRHWPVG